MEKTFKAIEVIIKNIKKTGELWQHLDEEHNECDRYDLYEFIENELKDPKFELIAELDPLDLVDLIIDFQNSNSYANFLICRLCSLFDGSHLMFFLDDAISMIDSLIEQIYDYLEQVHNELNYNPYDDYIDSEVDYIKELAFIF